jgi:hypothetical protein
MNYRTITMGPRSKTLHIEAPGCIINICQVEDATGRPVTRVDVNANADRYAGEPEWWALVGLDPKPCRGVGVRVIKGVKVQAEDEANARLIAAAPELLEALIALLCSSVYSPKPSRRTRRGGKGETMITIPGRRVLRPRSPAAAGHIHFRRRARPFHPASVPGFASGRGADFPTPLTDEVNR